MPTYRFQRSDGTEVSKRLPVSDFRKIKSGEKSFMDSDGDPLTPVFCATSSIGFSFKDGISGGWASKALKENKWRRGRSKVMAGKERDHVFKNKLIPNYKGEEAPTWADARLAAVDNAEPEARDAVAATYDPLVAKEKA